MRRVVFAVSVSCLVLLSGVRAADEKTEERLFTGFLYQGSDGKVWHGEEMATLGMWGTAGGVTEFCVSPDLATRFAPLVNHIGDVRDRRRIFSYTEFLGGGATLEQTPTILVRFRGRYRLVKEEKHGDWSGDRTYEITAATLESAELLPKPWMTAWPDLDRALVKIVETSLAAPGEEKKRQIVAAVESASVALNGMATVEVADEWQATVRRVEATARAVGSFRRRQLAGEWRRQLENAVARFRIQPKTPLPAKAATPPLLDALVAAETPQEFLANVKRSCPAWAVEEVILYSPSSKRMVYVWQVEDFTPAEFKQLREEAKTRLEERKNERPATRPAPLKRLEIPTLSLTVALPADDLIAERLVLSGVLIESVLPAGEKTGLKAGDLVLDYATLYDVVMGPYGSGDALKDFAARATQSKQEVRVIRGDTVIRITIDRSRP